MLTKNTKNSHFYLKHTNHNNYIIKSPEILIRKLSSIRIEREKYVKASKHDKNTLFDQKVHFFNQISERSICTHLHHTELDLGDQSHLKTVETVSAYPKTTWCEDSQLFCSTILVILKK